MDDRRQIGIAIVGCGTIAAYHAHAIHAVHGAVLAGAYSHTQSKVLEFCKAFGGIPYATYAALLEDTAVDAVAICTPSDSHFSLAKQALLHKKHIIIEKPMCLSLQEADELLAIGNQVNRSVSVISQTRFSPAVQAAAVAVQTGLFGHMISATLRMRYFRPQEYYDTQSWRRAIPAGGVLMNQGIHGIDLLCWLMGRPRSVCGFARTFLRQMDAENTVAAAIAFENGALATIDATVCSQPSFPRQLTLCGECGTIVLDEDAISVWSLPAPCPIPMNRPSGSSGSASSTGISYHDHAKQYENIVSHLRYGTSLLVDGKEGRIALALILGILDASKAENYITLRL